MVAILTPSCSAGVSASGASASGASASGASASGASASGAGASKAFASLQWVSGSLASGKASSGTAPAGRPAGISSARATQGAQSVPLHANTSVNRSTRNVRRFIKPLLKILLRYPLCDAGCASARTDMLAPQAHIDAYAKKSSACTQNALATEGWNAMSGFDSDSFIISVWKEKSSNTQGFSRPYCKNLETFRLYSSGF